MAQVIVDAKAIEELARDINKAKKQLLYHLGQKGYHLLREEVPKKTTNLQIKGVKNAEYDYENLTALIVVSATRDKLGAISGKVIGADGEVKKTVSLRAGKAFNYAEAVARGRPAITPKNGKALLIPVPTAPSGESYLLAGGQIYVFRRSAKATKPNPFDERAAKRLENEAPNIAEAILRKFV